MKPTRTSNTIKKCVIYARVSSKEQERGGFSIPAQLDFLQDYARDHNYKVVEIFTEAETAKKAGRANFNKMIELIKKNKDIKIILAEKTDRIYRNFKDYVILDEFPDLEVHLVKENMIISEHAPSHIKFMHGMKVLMAKNYIDNLSEEVIKGISKKCKMGYYPAKAPIGYINTVVKGLHIIEVDKSVAPYIKLAYELYISTNHSFKTLAQELTARGFRINNKPIRKCNIEKIFDNPIYYGDFIHNGVTYNGVHEPIVTKELWQAVQNKRKYMTTPKKIRHDFIFSGLIHCAHCNCLLVGEIKKQKYIYYHCTGNKGGNCKKNYLKQEIIETALEDILNKIYVTDEERKEIIEIIKDMNHARGEFTQQSVEDIAKQINILNNRIERAYDDLTDGAITKDFYNKKITKWQDELNQLEITLSALCKTNEQFYTNCDEILELAQNAREYYKAGTIQQKQNIVKLLCSNLIYDGENLHIYLNSAFEGLLKNAILKENLGQTDDVRTLRIKNIANNLNNLLLMPSKENLYLLETIKIFKKCA